MSDINDMRRTLVQAKTRITALQAQVEDARFEARLARVDAPTWSRMPWRTG